jgi:hypothetical protein
MTALVNGTAAGIRYLGCVPTVAVSWLARWNWWNPEPYGTSCALPEGPGAVLYTGPRSYTAEDRIHVLPVDRLWEPL